MELNELIVTGAAIALQLITLSAWQIAAYNCRWWRKRTIMLENTITQLARNSVQRDPRTGRYLPAKGKVIEL